MKKFRLNTAATLLRNKWSDAIDVGDAIISALTSVESVMFHLK
jgi:hypothetical protein